MHNLEIKCSNPLIKNALLKTLLESDLVFARKTTFVVDEPLGWAFTKVGSGLKDGVVLTDNRCPTYLLNLWDFGPRNVLPLTPLSELVRLLATSASPLAAADLSSPLTPAERHTVRLIAEGYTNREIAQRRHVSEGVVRNTVNAIHQKLNLYARVHIAFYYYGQWHLLTEWEHPSFLQP